MTTSNLRTITNLSTLMLLAKELGRARQSGDKERIKEAKRAHDVYRDMCLAADEMTTGYTYGTLS